MRAIRNFFIDSWRLMAGRPLLGSPPARLVTRTKYDPAKVISALKEGHHILGPTECELAAAELLEEAFGSSLLPRS